MPVADEIQSSWADEVEIDQGALPPPSEVCENGLKVVTEYKYDNDNKKVKIVRTYKIEKRVVSKVKQKRVFCKCCNILITLGNFIAYSVNYLKGLNSKNINVDETNISKLINIINNYNNLLTFCNAHLTNIDYL